MKELTAAIQEHEPDNADVRDEHLDKNERVRADANKVVGDVEKKIKKIQKEFTTMETKVSKALSKRKSQESSLQTMQQKLESLEAAQQDAMEEEDYELADTLDQQMAQTRESIEQTRAELEGTPQKLLQLEARKDELNRKEIALREDATRELQDLLDVHQEALQRFVDEASEWEKEQGAQLKSEQERMDLSKGQLADDEAWVQRESDKVEQLIVSQTGDDQLELDKLVEDQENVQSEIEHLRQQLNLKELEVKKISKRMNAVSKNIDLTRSKYRDQLERVEQKQHIIEEFRIKIDTDTAAFEESASKLALYTERKGAEAKQYQGACDDITGDLEAMHKRTKLLIARQEHSQDEKKRKERLAALEASNNEGTAQYRIACEKAEEALDVANQAVVRLSVECQQFKQQIVRFEARLPELEGEKKIAVSERNFKEAARVSSEIKEILAKKEEAVAKLAESEVAAPATEKALQSANEEVDGKRQALMKAGERGNKQYFHMLTEICAELRKDCKCKDTSSEIKELIEAEIEQYMQEASQLQQKYGFVR